MVSATMDAPKLREGHAERLPAGWFEALRRARLDRGLAVEEIAAAMDVRPGYLDALERGQLDRELGPAYVRSIAVRYAVCLGLDLDDVVDPQQDWTAPTPALDPSGMSTPRPPAAPGRTGDHQATPALLPDVPPLDLPRRQARAASGRPSAPSARRLDAPRRSGPTSRTKGARLRPSVLVALLVLGLVVVALLGGLLLGLDDTLAGRLFGGGVETTASTVAASVSSTAPTTATSLAGGVVPASGQATPTTLVFASTTTTSAGEAAGVGASGAGTPTTGPVASVAGSFVATLTPSADVWLEIRDEATDKALFIGLRAAGDPLRVESDGPVNAVVGKPEAVRVTIDGETVSTPPAQLWRVTAQGVQAR